MAFEESCVSIDEDAEEEMTIVATSSPKKRKRTMRILPENTSTPYSCAKKTRLQRPDPAQRPATPVPQVTFSTSIMRITRGVQTKPPPETVHRETQVSLVPKKQFTVAVQTESSCGTAAIACQASIDDLVPREEACVGTSLTFSPEKPPQDDAACQTTTTAIVVPEGGEESTPEQALTLMMLTTSANERCHQTTTTGDEFADSSVRRELLRRIAQSYGFDLSSSSEHSRLGNNKQNKKKHKKKKKNKDREHQDEVTAREQLLNETCETVMAKVDEKLSTVIAGHLDMYRRQMVHHRQRYLSWIQQQKTQLGAVRRKPIGKQNGIERSSVSLEEKAVQCDASSQRVTVATQWYRQPIKRSKVVKPKAVKPKVDSIKKPIKPPTISTDSKRPPAGQDHPEPESSRRQSLRQTKLPLYTESRPTSGDQRGRKGKHTPEPANLQPAVLAATATGDTATVRKRGQSTKRQPSPLVSPEPEPEPEHVEETPSEASDECRNDRKHYPYRAPPPVYLSQCSKSTATSCPTLSQLCNHHHRHHHQHHAAHQHRHPVSYGSDESTPGFSMLLSPLKRMCVGGKRGCSGHCTNNFGAPPPGSYLPMSSESIPPTPPRPKPPTMMYVNRSQPRVLIRTKGSNHVRTRDAAAPEVNIISSQELYTQIGRAVENAFRAKAMPTLATMYGEPFIETFNAMDEEEEEEGDDEDNSENPSFAHPRKVGQPPKPKPENQFVCSSGKDAVAGGVAGAPPRAPFYPGRSPSLSPIIYGDDGDEDGL